ncbi:MAG TPA: fructosamine kinase family protein [Ohtaekwangia sp.]|nr:fructosamine kinase family protein [Ohtaekwangia sp.]
MPLPPSVHEGILILLREKVSSSLVLRNFEPASGGCINHGGRLASTHGDFFVKWNDAAKYPGMFDAEAKGLELLGIRQAIDIPLVIGAATHASHQFIVMEFRESKPPSKTFWRDLGRQLAMLHRRSDESPGLDHDNYIGSLQQSNHRRNSWLDFFIQERILPQLRLANLTGTLMMAQFEKLFIRLPSLIPDERIALLHGDLWHGNLIVNSRGGPCLIDPAVYYGNREADLAMTQLFGGFDPSFFDEYQRTDALAPGFRERFDIYNLYPLLVHLNLFGSGYLGQISSILKKVVD